MVQTINFKIAGLMVLFLLALGGVTWATEPWVDDNNTIALWHCEESSGTTVEDDTGDYDGIASDENLLGSATSKVGEYSIYPDALYYFKHLTLFDVIMPTGTVEMWFRPDVDIGTSHANMHLWSKYNTGASTYDSLRAFWNANANQITFSNRIAETDYYITSEARTWTGGTWYHACFEWGTGGMKLYIDGVLESANENVTGHPDDGSAGDFAVGCYSDFQPVFDYIFNGRIDEIRISNIQRDCTITSPTTTTTTSTTTTTLEPTTTTTTLEPTTTTTVPGTTTTTLAPSEGTTNNSYLWIILLIIGLFLAIVLIK